MKDHLLDIVQHTNNLGFIDAVKIINENNTTKLEALSEDRSVVVQGEFKEPMPVGDFTFGMPNLSKLNTILNLPVYQENAKITVEEVERNGEKMPGGLHFENEIGDFKNDYRFMTKELADERIKSVKFKGVKWDVEFSPSAASIQRFKFQCQANAEETVFLVKTDNGDLKFEFGDHSTHSGNFVFQHDVDGKMSRNWCWPIKEVSSILNLPGDITMRFSDEGAAEISVDSGLAVYNYLLPAQSK